MLQSRGKSGLSHESQRRFPLLLKTHAQGRRDRQVLNRLNRKLEPRWVWFAVAASKTIKAPACFPTSVPLRSLGIYLSSVICTVRPKSTSTALSDIRTMLLAGENREKRSHCHILTMAFGGFAFSNAASGFFLPPTKKNLVLCFCERNFEDN